MSSLKSPGRNSGTPYRVQFLGIADSDSVTSSTLFSGNILQCAMNDVDPTLLKEQDPRTLGGIVVNAEIVYDAESQPAFAEVGWSANDFQMLRGWFAWDPELYGTPSLVRLHASLRRHGLVRRASLAEGRLQRALVTPLSLAAPAAAAD